MKRRAERQERLGPCRAIGCAEIIPGDHLFCERHDRMLHSDIRTILAKRYRPGRTQSIVFDVTLSRALYEILYAQQNGHRIPRSADFEFGDDAAGTTTSEVNHDPSRI